MDTLLEVADEMLDVITGGECCGNNGSHSGGM